MQVYKIFYGISVFIDTYKVLTLALLYIHSSDMGEKKKQVSNSDNR